MAHRGPGSALCRGYGEEHFREDLRRLYQIAGVQNAPVVFLFTDAHVAQEVRTRPHPLSLSPSPSYARSLGQRLLRIFSDSESMGLRSP